MLLEMAPVIILIMICAVVVALMALAVFKEYSKRRAAEADNKSAMLRIKKLQDDNEGLRDNMAAVTSKVDQITKQVSRAILDAKKARQRVTQLPAYSADDGDFLNTIGRIAGSTEWQFLLDQIYRGLLEAAIMLSNLDKAANLLTKAEGVRMVEDAVDDPIRIFGDHREGDDE
jgi:cell division protein FtsL